MHPLIYWEGATSKRDYVKILTQWETIMYTPTPIQTDDIILSDDWPDQVKALSGFLQGLWSGDHPCGYHLW